MLMIMVPTRRQQQKMVILAIIQQKTQMLHEHRKTLYELQSNSHNKLNEAKRKNIQILCPQYNKHTHTHTHIIKRSQ
jgi:hypothetical protein